jgi:hypothetical protein
MMVGSIRHRFPVVADPMQPAVKRRVILRSASRPAGSRLMKSWAASMKALSSPKVAQTAISSLIMGENSAFMCSSCGELLLHLGERRKRAGIEP